MPNWTVTPDIKMSSIKISKLQQHARAELSRASIETAALEARVLLCHVCQLSEVSVIADPDRLIDSDRAAEFFDLVTQRAKRIPLAHLLGVKEFWGLEFCVNGQTLIPRPETEFAVEFAIECAKSIPTGAGRPRILDLGTGTGCLLISILHELKAASGVGIDINPQAVDLATINARNLKVEKRTTFHCMDWGQDLAEIFDIIVSNPPYVLTGDLAGLMPEVARYEPHLALDGGVDGLDQYRKIIPQARQLLTDKGFLILEVGDGQARNVLEILGANGFQPHVATAPVKHDLAGCERIIAAVKVC